MQLIKAIATDGCPLADDILATPPNTVSAAKPLNSSLNDTRLWNAVLRNLFKEVPHRDNLTIPEGQQQVLVGGGTLDRGIVAFSCGHSFSEVEFQRKVLSEFRERLEDLPHPLFQATPFLLQYYKQLNVFSSSCPYCVFQHIRKTQLQNYSGVPIKPWNV